MKAAPQGWTWSTVAEVGHVELGRQRHPNWHTGPNMRPYLRVANVFEDRIDVTDLKEMDFTDVFDRYKLHPGDVLLNEGQTPELLGRPAIYRGVPEDVAFTNSLIRFQTGPSVTPEWALLVFRHHMHSGRFKRESRITTNIAHLSATRLKAVEFPVPPLYEQRRIVEILEEHLSHLDAGQASLEAAGARADGLLASQIATAMAEAGEDEAALGDVASSVKNGIFVSRPSAEPDGVPILRIGAVRPLELSLDDLRFSGMSEATLRESGALLDQGDLLFTRYNGNPRFVGASAVVELSALPLTYPDKLIRVRLDRNRVLPQFVCFATNFGAGRRQIEARLKTSAGQVGLAGGELKRVRISVPDLDSQKRLVDSIQQVVEARGRLRTTLEVAEQRHDRLKRAVLSAAFEGKLTGRHTDAEVIDELAQQ